MTMVAKDDRSPSGEGSSAHNGSGGNSAIGAGSLARSAVDFAKQSEKLSHHQPEEGNAQDVAIEARFVTPHDPVIITTDGNRLPGVPLKEAHKLNVLKDELQQESPVSPKQGAPHASEFGSSSDEKSADESSKLLGPATRKNGKAIQKSAEGSLRRAMPPSHTNPLFPPLPLYGPPSLLRNAQIITFQVASFFLSLAFLLVIVLGALFTNVAPFAQRLGHYMRLQNPDAKRPFYEEEKKRRNMRKDLERSWRRRKSQENVHEEDKEDPASVEGFIPTEGGPDPIKCDVAYYARRVGLDIEEFQVQTEDGFIIDLWHVYDPREYVRLDEDDRSDRGPEIFRGKQSRKKLRDPNQKRKFPVLLLHGLLQSSGAYCVNDDDSLAFYLCKSGYDVWLGNNRCGFTPRHSLLESHDPRMWCWNIRQMGVFDLPALVSRVLFETGFEKVGLICHSQGTTQTFVALAKEQRPELGDKLTVFCALAPAAYAGPLIGKMYFKFMRIITPAMFRLMFGIHAFIPFMMAMHRMLHPKVYGWLGYKVFSFLLDWHDTRWDRGLRNRMFQFAPVYVSAESMRWWLGRECFAKHKCILSTKEEWRAEEREDLETDDKTQNHSVVQKPSATYHPEKAAALDTLNEKAVESHRKKPKGSTAWYNEKAPPFALWICGDDDLVDGQKLLRRFERGREPHVNVVHSKVIPEYEHLDVIWAMDAPQQVFGEIREVLWKTCTVREMCRTPKGCENVPVWAKQEPPEMKHEDEDEEEEEEEEEGQSSSEADSSP